MSPIHQRPHSQRTQPPHSSNELTDRLAKELGAVEPRILHPMSGLFILLDSMMGLVIVVVAVVFQSVFDGGGADATTGLLSEMLALFPFMRFVLPIAVLALVLLPVLNFWFYRFQIIEGEFRIQWGIFSKEERHIPLTKIHNVAIKQTLLQRVLSVAEVTLESAGSGQESEAKLKVLSIDEALLLENAVNANNLQTQTLQTPNLSHQASHQDYQENDEGHQHQQYGQRQTQGQGYPKTQPMPSNQSIQSLQSRQLLGLSTEDIVRYGLISNAGIALGGFLTLILSPERIIQWLWVTLVPDDMLAKLSADTEISGVGDILTVTNMLIGEQSLFMQIAIWLSISLGLLVSVLVVSKIYSVISAFIRLYDFKLSEHGKNLTVEKGLFTRHKSNIPLGKIQVWRVEESWLHRLFNRQTLKLDTAVLGSPQSEQQTDRGISELVPIAEPESIEQLLTYWRQPFPEEYEFVPVHPMAFRRIVFMRILFITLLTMVACVILSKYMVLWILLAMLALGFAVFASHKRADYMGLVVTDSHILWRDGWLNRVCYIAEIPHAHAVAITYSPFDRRYDMATLIVDTVGGTLLQARITMKYLPYEVAEQVADIVRKQCG